MNIPISIRSSNNSGFTLMETLIVIAILALIILMLLANMSNQLAKGRDSTRKTDLRTIQKGLEEYFNDNNTYPENIDLIECGTTVLNSYIKKTPCDPVYKDAYYYQTGMPTARDGYVLCAKLEMKSDPDIVRIGCDPDTGCGWSEGYNYCMTSGAVTASSEEYTGPLATATPTATPTPTPAPGDYACTPGGSCNFYEFPVVAGCPFTYNNKDCIYNGIDQCGNVDNRCKN